MVTPPEMALPEMALPEVALPPPAVLAVGRIGERRVSLHTVEPDGSTTGEPVVIDLSQVPGELHEMRFDPRRRRLYVAHTYLGGWYLHNDGPARHISVIDPDTATLVDTIDLGAGPRAAHGAHDLWVDTGRDRIWASVEASPDTPGGLIGLDPDTGAVVAHIDAGVRAAHWFTVTPDGSRAYTANKENPFVSVLDLHTRQLIARVPVPGSEGIAAAPDTGPGTGLGDHVFVAGPCRLPGVAPAPPGVRVIDTDSNEVVELLATDHAVGAVHVTASALLLAAEMRTATGAGDPADGLLRIFSATTGAPVGAVPIGASVLTITSTPAGDLAFVADAHGGAVTVVDLRSGRVASTITGTAGAHGLAWIPTP